MNKKAIMNLIIEEAKRQSVPVKLALALVNQESGFNPNAKSKVGAIGLMQLMPATAKSLGVNPYNIKENIKGGITYLKNALAHYKGDIDKALAAYNAGFQAVDDYLKGTNISGQNPLRRKNANVYDGTGFKETKNYVKNIKAGMGKFDSVAEINMQKNEPIQQNNNNTILEGGISMNGRPTGAAANPYDYLGSEGRTPAQLAQDLQNVQATNAANLARLYTNLRPTVGNMTDLEALLMNQNFDATPEQIQQAANINTQNLAAGYQQIANENQNMRNLLAQKYNEARDVINSDPRLQNMGYSYNPETAKNVAILRNAGYNIVDPNELRVEAAKGALATQYGVPYDVLVAAQNDRIARLTGLNQNELNQLATMAANGNPAAQQYLTQLGALGQKGIEAVGRGQQQNREYLQKIVEEVYQRDRELGTKLLEGIAKGDETALQQVGNIINTITGNYGNLTQEQVRQAAENQRNLITNETQRINQGLNYEVAKQNAETAAAQVPAQNYFRTTGGLANIKFADPTLDTQGIIQAMPANVQQSVVNPSLTLEQQGQLFGGLQKPNPTSNQGLMNRFLQFQNWVQR